LQEGKEKAIAGFPRWRKKTAPPTPLTPNPFELFSTFKNPIYLQKTTTKNSPPKLHNTYIIQRP